MEHYKITNGTFSFGKGLLHNIQEEANVVAINSMTKRELKKFMKVWEDAAIKELKQSNVSNKELLQWKKKKPLILGSPEPEVAQEATPEKNQN